MRIFPNFFRNLLILNRKQSILTNRLVFAISSKTNCAIKLLHTIINVVFFSPFADVLRINTRYKYRKEIPTHIFRGYEPQTFFFVMHRSPSEQILTIVFAVENWRYSKCTGRSCNAPFQWSDRTIKSLTVIFLAEKLDEFFFFWVAWVRNHEADINLSFYSYPMSGVSFCYANAYFFLAVTRSLIK